MKLYMFRTVRLSIIRSLFTMHSVMVYVIRVCRQHARKLYNCTAVATDLGHPYWIYIIPTHDMHQWLLQQFLVLLMMDAESVRNM